MYDDNAYIGTRKLKDMIKEGVVRGIKVKTSYGINKVYVFNKFDETNAVYIDYFDKKKV